MYSGQHKQILLERGFECRREPLLIAGFRWFGGHESLRLPHAYRQNMRTRLFGFILGDMHTLKGYWRHSNRNNKVCWAVQNNNFPPPRITWTNVFGELKCMDTIPKQCDLQWRKFHSPTIGRVYNYRPTRSCRIYGLILGNQSGRRWRLRLGSGFEWTAVGILLKSHDELVSLLGHWWLNLGRHRKYNTCWRGGRSPCKNFAQHSNSGSLYLNHRIQRYGDHQVRQFTGDRTCHGNHNLQRRL